VGIKIYEAGPRSGEPLLFFHGFPGSHAQGKLLEPWLEEFSLRLFAPDRPGYGGSSPAEGGLHSFTAELAKLLSARNVEPRYILGVSGGTPAAYTAARRFSSARALGIVSGLGPWNPGRTGFSLAQNLGLFLARAAPKPLLTVVINALLRGRSPDEGFDRFARGLDEADQRALQDPAVRPLLLSSLEDSLRQGPAGILFDAASYTRAWLEEPERLNIPVKVWHGENDRLLSPAMALALTQHFPRSALRTFPGEGHYSLPVYRARELLADLTGRASSSKEKA
jgi:pimeloyl-ACP methyl ester carboxylesterase